MYNVLSSRRVICRYIIYIVVLDPRHVHIIIMYTNTYIILYLYYFLYNYRRLFLAEKHSQKLVMSNTRDRPIYYV